jgi:hypothetical protein
MISGVELGSPKFGKKSPIGIELVASAIREGKIEIWLDDLTTGKLVTTISVASTGGENNWKAFTKAVKNISGRHDVFLKFSPGSPHGIFIKSIRFLPGR